MSSRARIILIVGLTIAIAVCVRLGFWQLSRLNERRAANATAAAALALPELDLNATRETAIQPRRHVRVSGEYDHTREVILRAQSDREQPGVTVVTPLRISGRREAVLVARGFVPAPDAVTADIDSLREPGVVLVEGITLPLVSRADGGTPLERDGRKTWKTLDRTALSAELPFPLLDVFVLQTADSSLPRSPRRLSAPPLDDGPHLGYAIQWFAFGVIALVGGVALLGRR